MREDLARRPRLPCSLIGMPMPYDVVEFDLPNELVHPCRVRHLFGGQPRDTRQPPFRRTRECPAPLGRVHLFLLW